MTISTYISELRSAGIQRISALIRRILRQRPVGGRTALSLAYVNMFHAFALHAGSPLSNQAVTVSQIL